MDQRGAAVLELLLLLCIYWMEKQRWLQGRAMSQMDKGGICSQVEAGLISGGSSAPASLRTQPLSGLQETSCWDSPKGVGGSEETKEESAL